MKDQIKTLVKDALEETKETTGKNFEITEETILLGENAALDSFDFVSFVSALEEKIADTFDKNITIVSEKAFSKKYSPFKTMDRIADFVIELMGGEQ